MVIGAQVMRGELVVAEGRTAVVHGAEFVLRFAVDLDEEYHMDPY
jgi:hypothetical protein